MSAPEPEWMAALRAYSKLHGQKAAGALIGYSNGLVSAVLKGKYTGDLNSVKALVEGALLRRTVDCPVVGDIPRNVCINHQRRANDPKATNPHRVALAEECPKCPHATDALTVPAVSKQES